MYDIVKLANTFYKIAGSFAAGFIFICTERHSIFLAKRSKYVEAPLVWGSIGGGVETNEGYLEAARREVKEEAGSMPDIERILDSTVWKDGNFRYKTFLAKISPKTMDSWKPKLNHENSAVQWFEIGSLPQDLHPGLRWTLKKMKLI